MKKNTWALTLVLAAVSLALNPPTRLHAMFAPYTDRELIEKSVVIAQGEYLGQTEIQLGGQAGSLWLGVVSVRDVFKGNAQDKILLIAVPSPAKPVSSSDISFRPKQDGLWLLAARQGGPAGIYVADHPQRFVPAASSQAKIDTLRKLLRELK